MNTRFLTIIAGIAVFAALAIWFSTHKSTSENMMTEHMGNSTPIVSNINIPKLSPVEKLGKRRFDENCAACHGDNATGRQNLGPPLVHKIYEPNHHGDISFQLAAKNGVRAHHWPYGNMPPIPNVSEADITNIIAYVRTLQRANGIF